MTSDEVNQACLDKAAAMFASVTGKPCVNVDGKSGQVHYCHRIFDLSTVEDQLDGSCDWRDAEDARPDELTDILAISADLLDVGDTWWLDLYFDWYFVFAPEFVQRSARGDHSWVAAFLAAVVPNRTIPRPPTAADTTHRLPTSEALKYFG
jgi:hypothetical protein